MPFNEKTSLPLGKIPQKNRGLHGVIIWSLRVTEHTVEFK